MTGAMYAAVAGLRAHMSALNVIGNNISNVNTYGYKATRYTFNEALYTTSRSGANGTQTRGGRNPAQIGYGCSVGTIDLDMSSKNPSPTAFALDSMIDGDGFFVVGDLDSTGVTNQAQLKGLNLTRLGNFDVKDGYLVDGEGSVVYGYLKVKVTEKEDDGQNQNQGDEEELVDPNATEYATILAPIRIPMAIQYNDVIKNEDGTETPVVRDKIFWPSQSIENGTVTDGQPTEADQLTEQQKKEVARVSVNTVSIDTFGRVQITTSNGELHTVACIAIAKVDSPNGVTHVDGRYYQAQGGAGDVHLTTVGGIVEKKAEGANAGKFVTVENAGNTGIVNSCLESSGTDLANEITNMITIQRGYQANTRIVSVTDSMLEELVNMKR